MKFFKKFGEDLNDDERRTAIYDVELINFGCSSETGGKRPES